MDETSVKHQHIKVDEKRLAADLAKAQQEFFEASHQLLGIVDELSKRHDIAPLKKAAENASDVVETRVRNLADSWSKFIVTRPPEDQRALLVASLHGEEKYFYNMLAANRRTEQQYHYKPEQISACESKIHGLENSIVDLKSPSLKAKLTEGPEKSHEILSAALRKSSNDVIFKGDDSSREFIEKLAKTHHIEIQKARLAEMNNMWSRMADDVPHEVAVSKMALELAVPHQTHARLLHDTAMDSDDDVKFGMAAMDTAEKKLYAAELEKHRYNILIAEWENARKLPENRRVKRRFDIAVKNRETHLKDIEPSWGHAIATLPAADQRALIAAGLVAEQSFLQNVRQGTARDYALADAKIRLNAVETFEFGAFMMAHPFAANLALSHAMDMASKRLQQSYPAPVDEEKVKKLLIDNRITNIRSLGTAHALAEQQDVNTHSISQDNRFADVPDAMPAVTIREKLSPEFIVKVDELLKAEDQFRSARKALEQAIQKTEPYQKALEEYTRDKTSAAMPLIEALSDRQSDAFHKPDALPRVSQLSPIYTESSQADELRGTLFVDKINQETRKQKDAFHKPRALPFISGLTPLPESPGRG